MEAKIIDFAVWYSGMARHKVINAYKRYLREHEANISKPDEVPEQVFKKIPIIISKYSDDDAKGWRAEIADNYENYSTSKYSDINFEDIGFHFPITNEYVFKRRKDAVDAAKEANKNYLNNKAKIWFI